MKKYILFVGILLAAILVAGCTSQNDTASHISTSPTPTLSAREVCGNVHSYGNGVIYFGCSGDTFMNALDEYIAKHPNMTITSCAPDPDAVTWNYVNGYIVTVKRAQRDTTSPFL
jgi:hypothetical protein